MKISIITVCYNSEKWIKTCMDSILHQDYQDIEYILIDGNSKDKTVDIIKSYQDSRIKWISEPDKGLYDAMNKGVKMATGEVVGILNSDDFYAHNQVISKVMAAFEKNPTDTLFADLVFVTEENLDKVVRFFPGKGFSVEKMPMGIMPPHPTFFVKRHCYEKYGYFDTNYRIAADFDIILRMLYKNKCTYQYLPEVIVKMRTGGASTQGIKSTIRINKEQYAVCQKNGVKTSMLKLYSKYFSKIWQLVRRPS
ncbi:MAG: glycosyltransferase family 2 protein [Bacteroidia bacterium]